MWYRFAQEHQELPIKLPDYVTNGVLPDIMNLGGRALVVGGAVRDAILGSQPKDIDFEVYRVSYEDLTNVLKKYGKADLVGQSFGVIKFVGPDGQDFDFSLPRTDSKSGVGHKDFNVNVSSDLNPKEAAARRDFTINAISYDPMTHEIIDPYNGRNDLQNKILRHTSEAFSEDPLRVLRGMQFAARYGFDLAPETAQLAKSIKDQYQHLPKERVHEEFKKLVTKGKQPGSALKFLNDTEWDEHFPQILDLKGVEQDSEFHPEGWSFSIVSSDFFLTGMAEAHPIDLLSREFLDSSLTNPATVKSFDITGKTKPVVQSGSFIRHLKTTNNTGVRDHFLFPTIFPPTSVAPPKGSMGLIRTATQNANKIIGVMFEVSLSRVNAIMQSSINNSEIVQGIIQPVAVYVMNMLSAEQIPAQKNLHNISVQKNASFGFRPRNGNFRIASNIINAKFSIVNNNIVFYFYLSSVGDVDIHNINISEADLHILVNVGDVSTHTQHVMNEAAAIADRENLSPEQREVLIYAALAHDFAKPPTTKTIFKKDRHTVTSYGHEEAGGPMAREFLESIGVNEKIIQQVVPLVENHLNHVHYSYSPKQDAYAKHLAERLHPSNIRMLELLIEADHSGRPPLPRELPEQARLLSEKAKEHNVYEQKHPNYLQGKDIMQYLSQGGPLVGKILSEHRKMLLDHHPEMMNEDAARKWLANRMRRELAILKGNDVVNVLGLKGRDIQLMLDKAWEAQRNREFNDYESGIEWLKGQNN